MRDRCRGIDSRAPNAKAAGIKVELSSNPRCIDDGPDGMERHGGVALINLLAGGARSRSATSVVAG